MTVSTFTFASTTFGIEIECLVPANSYGLQSQIDAACGRNVWTVGTDGSVRANERGAGAGFRGVEIRTTSYVTGATAKEAIDGLCGVLATVGAYVNKSCGLHVHVGARNMSAQQIAKICAFYAKYEGEIDAFMAPSRRESNSPYCKSLFGRTEYANGAYTRTTQDGVIAALAQCRTVADIGQVVNGSYQPHGRYPEGRYHKVNVQCFERLGTVEFRQHQGTVEAHKIWNWVQFLGQTAVAAAKWKPIQARGTMTSKAAFRNLTAALTPDVRAYLTARTAHFDAQ